MNHSDLVYYTSYLPKKPDVVYPIFLTEDGRKDTADITNLFYSRKKVDEHEQLHRPQIKVNKIPDVKVIGKNVKYDAQVWRPMQLSSNQPTCYLSMSIDDTTGSGGQQNLLHAGQLMRMSGTNFLLQVQAFLVDPDKTLSVLLVDGEKQVSVVYFIVFV